MRFCYTYVPLNVNLHRSVGGKQYFCTRASSSALTLSKVSSKIQDKYMSITRPIDELHKDPQQAAMHSALPQAVTAASLRDGIRSRRRSSREPKFFRCLDAIFSTNNPPTPPPPRNPYEPLWKIAPAWSWDPWNRHSRVVVNEDIAPTKIW